LTTSSATRNREVRTALSSWLLSDVCRRPVRPPERTQPPIHDLVQLTELNDKGGHSVSSRRSQPEAEPLILEVRQAESRQAVLVATVGSIRQAADTEDTIAATRSIPATLSGSGYHPLRVRNDEVVGRLVAPEQALTNSLQSSFVPRALLWRERLANHVLLVIAI